MSDHLDPRDELASAYLDGEVTADEAARVESDPELLARVETMRAAGALLRAPVDTPDPARRERSLDAALAAADQTPAVIDLDLARARRAKTARVLGIAAAILLLIVAVPLVARLGDGDDDDTAARAPASEELRSEVAEDSGGDDLEAGAGAADEAAPEAGATTTARLDAFKDLDELEQELSRRTAESEATGPSGGLPGADCSAVSGQQVLVAAPVILDGREVTAFVVTDGDAQRLVVVDPATCEVIADQPL